MNILNIFENDAFSAIHLTEAINVVPNNYGRLNELNLFPSDPVATTSIAVPFEEDALNLLPTRQRGAPPTLGTATKKTMRNFTTLHIPHEERVMAEDVQNVVSRTGESGALEAVQEVVNKRLATMRNKHAITLEYLRFGALTGVVYDADGTALIDYFAEFGVTQKDIDFVLGTGTTDIRSKVRELSGYMEDNLFGEVMTSVHALCSPSWFESFISHEQVNETFKYYEARQADFNPNREDVRRAFPFMGVMFEEHRGNAQVLQEDGTFAVRKFIADDEAIAFPLGTNDTFSTYFAPASFIDAVNTMGEEIYVRQAVDQRFNQFVDLHAQSNPLPIVKRPRLLVKLSTSD